jgi:hypothetical protein
MNVLCKVRRVQAKGGWLRRRNPLPLLRMNLIPQHIQKVHHLQNLGPNFGSCVTAPTRYLEYCKIQFSSGLMPIEVAKGDIQERFNVHKCERSDVNRASARIVRETTKEYAPALRHRERDLHSVSKVLA